MERQVTANVELLANEVVDVVEQTAGLVDILGAFAAIEVGSPDGDLHGEFPVFSQVLLSQDNAIRSVQLGPDSILVHVFPIAGNEAAVGLDLLADPDRRALLEPSILSGDMTFQGPVGLVQGGTGLIVRRPIYLDDGSFWGFAALVLDWDVLLSDTRLERTEGIVSAIEAPGAGVIAGDPAAFQGDPITQALQIGETGTTWTLASRPSGGWPRVALITRVIWPAGLVVALLAGAFTWNVSRRPLMLQREVDAALAELALSEARYQAAFEHAGTGIVVVDRAGRIVSANPQFQAIVGEGAGSSLVGSRLLGSVHPDDRRKLTSWLRGLSEPNGLAVGEIRLGPPGRIRWCKVRITVMPGLADGPGLLVGVAADITESRMVEEALAESERKYRELFAAVPVGIQQEDYTRALSDLARLTEEGIGDVRAYLLEADGALERVLSTIEVTAVNPTARVFQTGLRASGDTLLEVVTPETRAGFVESLVAIAGGTRDGEFSIEADGADGVRRTLQMRWHLPIRDGEPDFSSLLMTMADVSVLRRTEERLARLVEAKDRFVASVAHELRTPLTAVVGFARALADSENDLSPAELTELHGLVVSHAEEMTHLIEDLLVSGRSDLSEVRVHIERIDLGEVAREATFGLPGVAVGLETPGKPVHAMADPVRVRQIVRNLITNASRYGGDDIRVVVCAVGESVAVEVSDDGPRLSQQESERIFEPYERISSEFAQPGSIGLGLTVSRSLAHLLGGQLVLERVGERNVFRLTLPQAD